MRLKDFALFKKNEKAYQKASVKNFPVSTIMSSKEKDSSI